MEQTQTEAPKITKDMTIGDILEHNKEHAMKLSEIMTDVGLHCVGCGAATFETLEQGVVGHGMSQEVLDKLVKDLSVVLEDAPAAKVEHSDTPISLTLPAITKVKELLLKNDKKEHVLRVAVLAGGCAGHSYDLALVAVAQDNDVVFKQDGITIAVDKGSLDKLDGVEVDYVDTLNESGFKFGNPNAKSGCGCGSSFN